MMSPGSRLTQRSDTENLAVLRAAQGDHNSRSAMRRPSFAVNTSGNAFVSMFSALPSRRTDL